MRSACEGNSAAKQQAKVQKTGELCWFTIAWSAGVGKAWEGQSRTRKQEEGTMEKKYYNGCELAAELCQQEKYLFP